MELGVDAAEQRRLAHIAAHVLFFAFCDLGNGIFNWVANSENTGISVIQASQEEA